MDHLGSNIGLLGTDTFEEERSKELYEYGKAKTNNNSFRSRYRTNEQLGLGHLLPAARQPIAMAAHPLGNTAHRSCFSVP